MRRAHEEREPRPIARRAPTPATAVPEQELSGAPPLEAAVQSLQRSAGNAAVGRLLGRDGTARPGTAAGQPLPPTIQVAAERRLQTDLSDVRVHDDAAASDFATTLGAEAVTVGQDVYFRGGAPDPGTSRGQKLYVHELTHAAQAPDQTDGERAAKALSHAGSPPEREAVALAAGGFFGTPSKPAESANPAVAHRQVAAEEEQLEGQVPGLAPGPAPTTTGESTSPAVGAGSPTPTVPAPPLSPLVALFGASVGDPLRLAGEAVRADPPEPEAAYSHLEQAKGSVHALIGSYSATDPLLAESLKRLSNAIVGTRVSLEPKLGIDRSYEQIAKFIDSLQEIATEVRGRLH